MSKKPFLNKKHLLIVLLVTPVASIMVCASLFTLANPPSPKPKVENPTATYNQAVSLCKTFTGTEHEQCMANYGW
jgi:hypothetical protein